MSYPRGKAPGALGKDVTAILRPIDPAMPYPFHDRMAAARGCTIKGEGKCHFPHTPDPVDVLILIPTAHECADQREAVADMDAAILCEYARGRAEKKMVPACEDIRALDGRHTPEPWAVRETLGRHPVSGEKVVVGRSIVAHCAKHADPAVLATMGGQPGRYIYPPAYFVQLPYNARLMASAPTLLRLVKAAVPMLRHLYPVLSLIGAKATAEKSRELLAEAETLIAQLEAKL